MCTHAFITNLSNVPPPCLQFSCLFVGQCAETEVPTSQREWTQFLGRTVRKGERLLCPQCQGLNTTYITYLYEMRGILFALKHHQASLLFRMELTHAQDKPTGLDWPGV